MREQLVALQSAERALRETDRRKDEFLAMLAHELRNPLAPIRTAVELLPRLTSPGNRRIETIGGILSRQTRQLSRLVDDLLDVSRVTQGRIEIQRGPVDLSAVVHQALESVDSQIREKQQTLPLGDRRGIVCRG